MGDTYRDVSNHRRWHHVYHVYVSCLYVSPMYHVYVSCLYVSLKVVSCVSCLCIMSICVTQGGIMCIMMSATTEDGGGGGGDCAKPQAFSWNTERHVLHVHMI
jgi:hypothetical protein